MEYLHFDFFTFKSFKNLANLKGEVKYGSGILPCGFLQEPISISVVSLISTSLPDGRPCIMIVKH